MADARTFTLIGNFTDNITPALEKINKSLDKVKANLSSLQSVTKPLKKDFQELADVSNKFSSSLKSQANDLRDMTAAMRAYRNEMGRVNRAYKAGGGKITRQAAAAIPSAPTAPGGGRRGGASFAAGAGGAVAGYQLGDMITSSIVRGFQLGVSIMEKPFQYFGNALGERVQDQMQDLKAAGAFYSISQRQQKPFLASIDEAIQFQQDSNRAFAKMAAALPGVTNDYVQVSKRVGDTIARIVTSDMPNAIKEANKIRATEEGRQFYGAQITGMGPKQIQQTITTLTGDLTKKTVLAGLGGRAGAGGMMGAYGLPGLAERMLSQDQVSMGQFQRYAAIFGDPMIADALQRNVDKINATEKNSLARLNAFNKMMDEIVTPDLIDKLRTSVDGVYQGLKSAILDPDMGLFGLGRQMQGMGKRMNSFGQYLDKFNKVTDDVNKAAADDLSLFEMMADIFSKTGQVLTPIVNYLPEVFDPLKKIGEALKDARTYTARFAVTFNNYREGLKAFAKTLDEQSKLKIMETLDIRASLAAVNNLFAEFGVYGADATKEFSRIAKMLQDPKANIGAILSELMNTLFSSDIAKNIGEFIGNLVGTVIKTVGDMMEGATDFATAGPFAKGLKKGWDAAQGSLGISKIFSSLFKIIGNLLMAAFKAAPFEMSLLTALTVGMPIISGLVTAGMTALFESVFSAGLFNFIKTKVMNMIAAMIVRASVMTTTPAAAGAALTGGAGVTGLATVLSRLVPLLTRFSLIMTGVIIVGGGVENTFRQLQSVLNQTLSGIWGSLTALGDLIGEVFQWTSDLIGGVVDLGVALLNLIPGVNITTGAFDTLRAVLVPLTATFDLIEVALLLFVEGLTKARAWLTSLNPFASAKEKEAANRAAAEAGRKRVTAMKENDAYYTSIRYGKTGTPPPTRPNFSKIGAPPASGPALYSASNPATISAITTTSKQTTQINAKSSQQIQKITQTNQLLAMMSAQLTMLNSTMMTGAFKMNALTLGMQSLNINNGLGGGGNLGGLGGSNKGGTGINWFTGQQLPSAPKTGRANGAIGSAIMDELARMPSGSHLVVANSSETIMPKGYSMAMNQGGGPVTVNAPVTIHQQPGQDAEELASIVAIKIGEAVAQARSSSVFV